jgi:hypothetical protein
MSDTAIQPIFLFSLPRAGSTLLQRMLGRHERIGTAAEPWVLLPLLYARRADGISAEYGHRSASRAVSEFASVAMDEAEYQRRLRAFVLGLYGAAAPEADFFLDKTPRYSLIVDEVIDLFPDAKFIFLWRNPLAAVASMVRNFNRSRWKVYGWQSDLYKGLANLLGAARRLGDDAVQVRYEDLVQSPEPTLRRITDFLGVSYEPAMIEDFARVDLPGSMGDPGQLRQSTTVAKDRAADDWQAVITNPLRKRWCRRYLHWLGRDGLAQMGYDQAQLLAQVKARRVGVSSIGRDAVYLTRAAAGKQFNLAMIRDWRPLARSRIGVEANRGAG